MSHADPWDETPRLEALLDADLLAQAERSRIRASAEAFCVGMCRVDGACRLERALSSREQCPLWMYVRTMPLQT